MHTTKKNQDFESSASGSSVRIGFFPLEEGSKQLGRTTYTRPSVASVSEEDISIFELYLRFVKRSASVEYVWCVFPKLQEITKTFSENERKTFRVTDVSIITIDC